MQNNTEIDILIGKVLSGNASENETKSLESWRVESPENERYFSEAKKLWEISQQPVFNTGAAWEKVKAQTIDKEKQTEPTKVVSLKTWLSIAASLLLIASASIWVWKTQNPNRNPGRVIAWQSYESSGREALKLADSSKIDLRKGSRLKFPEKFIGAERAVVFEGTGFFNITKNTEQPFVITTPHGTVTVLGTSFLLETNDALAQLKVYVEEGKVSVKSNTNITDEIILTAGEMAFVNDGVLVEADSIPENVIAWKSNKMKFTNATLSDVMSALEDIYGIDVLISDSKLLECRFTGRFNKKSWKKIIKQLSLLYGFEYEIQQKQVLIKGGNAC